LLDRMRDERAKVHQLIHEQSVAKWLERMGDHATNLAEEVIFMLEGRDVRHPQRRTTPS
jgi:phosphate transport system protein